MRVLAVLSSALVLAACQGQPPAKPLTPASLLGALQSVLSGESSLSEQAA